MFDHVSLGVSDFAKSFAFYDRALGALGLNCLFQDTSGAVKRAGYGAGAFPGFWIAGHEPIRGKLHIAFIAASRDAVKAFHAEALAVGGTDNGEPGYRPYHPSYYAAYVLDPDGHNIEAVFHDPDRR